MIPGLIIQGGPVTDDIGNLAKIRLFHVGFGQKNGVGVVHIDEKPVFYRAHPQGVKTAPMYCQVNLIII